MKTFWTIVTVAGCLCASWIIGRVIYDYAPGRRSSPAYAHKAQPTKAATLTTTTPTWGALLKPEPCPKEANLAVLNKLAPELMGIDDAKTVGSLDRADSKIACIREWAKSLPSGCIKSEYETWLDYYARLVKNKREELADTGTAESSSDKWQREYSEEQARVRDYEKANPVPKPPSCERELIRKVKP